MCAGTLDRCKRWCAAAFLLVGCGPVMAVDCLEGPDATGLEIGPQTLNVTLINGPPNSVLTPQVCEPSSAFVIPGASGGGSGTAEFAADHSGYSLNTTAITGGETAGNSSAAAIGAVRYVFVIDALPGYAGPGAVNVDISALYDIGGSVSVSGVGSAGGTYTTSASMKRVIDQTGAVTLFGNAGMLAAASASIATSTQSVNVGEEYEVQFVHNQNVIATSAVAPMTGNLGSAASSGTARISFDVQIAPVSEDAALAIRFPMVVALGVPAPALGTPPLLPSEQPAVATVPALPTLACAVLALMLSRLLRYGRDRRDRGRTTPGL